MVLPLRKLPLTLASLALLALARTLPAAAGVALDGTLPNGRTDVLAGPSYAITEDMGFRVGGNLFHSFFRFDIGDGETATFSADPLLRTDNVIARVTSWDPVAGQAFPQASQIDGTIRFDPSLADANLFLVNPAGVVFGPDAEVEVSGATYATSADYLRFDDAAQTRVDSRSPDVDWNGLTLETASPAAFGFLGGTNAAEVRVDGDPNGFSALSLQGAGFAAIGGDVTVTQAVSAPGARVQLAAVGRAAVEVPVDVEQFDTLAGDPAELGSVTVRPTALTTALIDTTDFSDPSAPQGRIVIRGGRFEVEGTGVFLLAGDAAGSGAAIDVEVAGDASVRSGAQLAAVGLSPDGFGGVRLAAGGAVEIDGATVASDAEGGGDGGGVAIGGGSVDVAGGAQVLSISHYGSAGDVSVVADGPVSVDASQVDASAGSASPGGSVSIGAGALDVRNGGTIGASSSASASGGSIEVAATDVSVRGTGSAISTLTQVQTPGDPGAPAGGDITIAAGSGNVAVAEGGAIATQTTGSRAGGHIGIATGNLSVSSGGLVEASTTGGGDGGGVDVDATSVAVSGTPGSTSTSQISAVVAEGATGRGGSIRIGTESLALRDGGQIRTTTRGDGSVPGDAAGGDLTVEATGAFEAVGVNRAGPNDVRPSGLFARSSFQPGGGSGDGGDIQVTAQSIELRDGAEIASQANFDGTSGNITLDAPRVRIAGGDGASLVTAATVDGMGGSVHVLADSLEVVDGGGIDVSTFGSGPGGSLTIEGGDVRVSGRLGPNRSELHAEAFGTGNADGISLRLAGDLRLEDGGEISALSTGTGRAGHVTVERAGRVSVGSGARITVETQGGLPGSVGGSILLQGLGALRVARGGEISARALGQGDGGDVSIRARGPVTLSGGTVTAEAASGRGGDVSLRGGLLVALTDGADVSARAAGAEPAGNVAIGSGGLLAIGPRSRVTAEAAGSGDAGSIQIAALRLDALDGAITTQAAEGLGGNIDVRVPSRVLLRGSEISTSVKGGTGSGGNIQIDPSFVVLDTSRIVAQADRGAGGNIQIRADTFIQSGQSLVDASSNLGIDGTVVVSAPEAELAGQIATLPENLLDATALLREACEARSAPVGTFSVHRVGPLLPPPDAPLSPSDLEGEGECREP